jgi:hypothetical protein
MYASAEAEKRQSYFSVPKKFGEKFFAAQLLCSRIARSCDRQHLSSRFCRSDFYHKRIGVMYRIIALVGELVGFIEQASDAIFCIGTL